MLLTHETNHPSSQPLSVIHVYEFFKSSSNSHRRRRPLWSICWWKNFLLNPWITATLITETVVFIVMSLYTLNSVCCHDVILLQLFHETLHELCRQGSTENLLEKSSFVFSPRKCKRIVRKNWKPKYTMVEIILRWKETKESSVLIRVLISLTCRLKKKKSLIGTTLMCLVNVITIIVGDFDEECANSCNTVVEATGCIKWFAVTTRPRHTGGVEYLYTNSTGDEWSIARQTKGKQNATTRREYASYCGEKDFSLNKAVVRTWSYFQWSCRCYVVLIYLDLSTEDSTPRTHKCRCSLVSR